MTKLTIEDLNEPKFIREEISREQSKLEALKISATSFNFAMNDTKVQSKAQTAATEKFALMIFEAENRLSELESKLADVTSKLAKKICVAFRNGLFVSILIQHYCGGRSFSVIANKLNYTRDYVWKLHKRAIAALSATNEEN